MRGGLEGKKWILVVILKKKLFIEAANDKKQLVNPIFLFGGTYAKSWGEGDILANY